MKCPKCGSDQNVVINYIDKDNHVTRTRGCNGCGAKFVTVETIKTGERTSIGGANNEKFEN